MKSFKTIVRMTQSAVLTAVAVTALMVPAGVAASGSQQLSIHAKVLKRASLTVMTQPSAVVVTAADIERGYVDVPAPAHVTIQSNSLSGYLIDFASQGDFIRQILVKGLASDVQLSPQGGAVMQPSSGGVTKTTLALGFRFILAESTQQGIYPWPMRLSVTPL